MINWKRFGRNGRGLILLFRHSSGGTEESHEKLSQHSQSPGGDMKPGQPEYEARMLTTTFGLFLPMNDPVPKKLCHGNTCTSAPGNSDLRELIKEDISVRSLYSKLS
jgi:hypothetical protein